MLASRKEKELEYRLWWIQSGDQEDGLEYLDVNCWGGPAENQVQDISSLVWWGAAVECQVETCKKRDKAGGLDLVSADVKVPKRVREVTSVGQLSYWKMSSLLKRTYYIFRQSDGSPVCIDVQTAWQKKKHFLLFVLFLFLYWQGLKQGFFQIFCLLWIIFQETLPWLNAQLCPVLSTSTLLLWAQFMRARIKG